MDKTLYIWLAIWLAIATAGAEIVCVVYEFPDLVLTKLFPQLYT